MTEQLERSVTPRLFALQEIVRRDVLLDEPRLRHVVDNVLRDLSESIERQGHDPVGNVDVVVDREWFISGRPLPRRWWEWPLLGAVPRRYPDPLYLIRATAYALPKELAPDAG